MNLLFPFSSIAVSLPNGPGIAPGEKSPLIVMVTEPDGKVLRTEGKGGGKVLWKDLTITAGVVAANPKGIVSFPAIQGSATARWGMPQVH